MTCKIVRNLGQDLFAPPNVKGWDGGLSWITTNNLLSRYNEAAALVQGDMSGAGGATLVNNPKGNAMIDRMLKNAPLGRVNPDKLITQAEREDKERLLSALEKRLVQDKLKPKQQAVLRDFLDSKPNLADEDLRNAIRLVMSTPEYQLC